MYLINNKKQKESALTIDFFKIKYHKVIVMRIVEFLGIRIKMLRLMISKIKIQFDKIILKVKLVAVKLRMKIVTFSKKSKRSPKSL